MTHSLHRRGKPEELKEDYIILVTAAANINNEGAIPKIAKVLDVLWDIGPTNIGSNETGKILSGVTKEIIRENLSKVPRIRCLYNSKEKTWRAIKEIKELDLGMSVTLQGPIEDILEMSEKFDINPHSINYSLDIWGKKEKLPDEEILQFTTMCGHGLIAENLVKDITDKVKKGKMTPEAGAKKMGAPCVCGFYNPERSLKILKEMCETEK